MDHLFINPLNLNKMRKRVLVDTDTNNRVRVHKGIDRKIYELRKKLGKTKQKPTTPSEEGLQKAWRAHASIHKLQTV